MKRGSIMFCPKCGAQNPDGSPFCASCGAQLGQPQPQPMQQPQMNQNPAANFNNQIGNAFKSADLNPKSMIDDFLAFFKKPAATIQQIIAWAGALLLLISTFLPNHTIKVTLFGMSESKSWNLWSGRGFFYWFFFLIFILAVLFFTTIKRDICVLALGGLCTIWGLLNCFTITKNNVSTAAERALYGNYFSVSRGIGCWLIIISSLAILAAGVWGFLEAKKKS